MSAVVRVATASTRDLARRTTVFVASAPATYILLLIVTVTTLVLRGVDATTVDRVLREHSTNLVHMSRDAPRVLFLSMFLLGGGSLWRALLLFTVLLAPVERWLGTAKVVVVFVAGHVGATLATTIGIWVQARAGVGASELSYVVDVGVSYGLAAAAGVLVFRVQRAISILLGTSLVAYVLAAIVRSGTFTDWGHFVALLIGFALGPLVRPTTITDADRGSQLPRWERWALTPGAGTPAQRRRAARVGGIVLVALGAGLVALGLVVDTDLDLPRPPGVLAATVSGDPVSCGRSCAAVDVRLRRPVGPATGAGTVRLLLPPETEARRGATVAVRPVPGAPDEVRLAAVARRVDVRGLLGETAVPCVAIGTALLAIVGRRHRVT